MRGAGASATVLSVRILARFSSSWSSPVVKLAFCSTVQPSMSARAYERGQRKDGEGGERGQLDAR